MAPGPEQDDDHFRHRPLPSVDIALLPGDVRAARMQRVTLTIVGGIGLVLVLGVAFGPGVLSRLSAHQSDAPTTSAAPALSGEPSLALEPMPTAPAGSAPVEVPVLVANAPTLVDDTTPVQPTPEPPPTAEALPPTAADDDSHQLPDEESTGRVERKFGQAKSFRDALLKASASPEEANDILAALQKLVDFRHGKPEQTLVFERNAAGTLRMFEYRAGLTEIYRVTRDKAGKPRGERVVVPIEKRRIAKGTQIAGSLGHSLAALGLGAALAGAVIEAFDSKLSFKKDTRTGDSLKLIVDEEYVDGTFLRYGNVLAIEYSGERAGKLQAFWFETTRGHGEFYDPSGRAMHGGWLRTPLRYDHISSPYNLKRRHPILKRIVPHLGVDYSAGTGTPVWAAADGVVTFAAAKGPNGNLVSLKHNNGYESHYAHLWRIAPGMKPGTHVAQRQLIGYVGTTGRSTGPHLHFALKRSGRFIDPAAQLNGPGLPLPAAQMSSFRGVAQRLRGELDRISVASAPVAPVAPEPIEDESVEDEVDL